jgi:hypothetical protein
MTGLMKSINTSATIKQAIIDLRNLVSKVTFLQQSHRKAVKLKLDIIFTILEA